MSQLKFKDKKNDISILEYETNLYEIGLCDLENYIKMFQSTDPEDELKEIEILKVS